MRPSLHLSVDAARLVRRRAADSWLDISSSILRRFSLKVGSWAPGKMLDSWRRNGRLEPERERERERERASRFWIPENTVQRPGPPTHLGYHRHQVEESQGEEHWNGHVSQVGRVTSDLSKVFTMSVWLPRRLVHRLVLRLTRWLAAFILVKWPMQITVDIVPILLMVIVVIEVRNRPGGDLVQTKSKGEHQHCVEELHDEYLNFLKVEN